MTQASSNLEKHNAASAPVILAASTPSRWITGRWRTIAISIILFSAALFLDLRHLAAPSIWFDEAFSVELARQPLPLLWHIIFGPEPNMELYYLFLHFWLGFTQSLGLLPTEFVVRFPSTIFAALSTVVVFWLGKRYINLFAGVLAASLYMLNYLQLLYAQQTRSYSMQLLFICLAWYALFNALTGNGLYAVGAEVVDDVGREPLPGEQKTMGLRFAPSVGDRKGSLPTSPLPSALRKGRGRLIAPLTNSRGWWMTYVLMMALAVYAHLFSLLILLSQVIAVALLLLMPNAWRAAARTQLRACVVSLLALGVLILAMLIESRQGAKTGWLAVPHKNDIIYLTQMLSGFSRTYLLVIAIFCAVGMLLVGIAYILGFFKGRYGQAQGFLRHTAITSASTDIQENEIATGQQLFPVMLSMLCWLLIPPIVSYIVSQGSLRLFSSRYLVVIVPPLCLLMALGVSMLRWSVVLTRGQQHASAGAGVKEDEVEGPSRSPLPQEQDKPFKSKEDNREGRLSGIRWIVQSQGDRKDRPYVISFVQGIFALLLLVLALSVVPRYYKSAQVEDWNTVSHWIIQHYQQNDGLVCYDNDVQQGCQISVEYYFHAYPSAAHFDSDTPGGFSWTQFTSNNPDAAVDPNVLASYGAKHGRIFFIVGRLPDERAAAKAQVAQQWLDNHFHLVDKFEKRTVTVRLYEA